MNTTLARERIRKAIKEKRIIVVKHFREEESLPVETRLIPLDIIEEIRGIAKQQSYLIGFEIGLIPQMLEEKHFHKFIIEAIAEVRITAKSFDPQDAVKLYRMMKRTPTVAWNISRQW
jgi:hypothetical protein